METEWIRRGSGTLKDIMNNTLLLHSYAGRASKKALNLCQLPVDPLRTSGASKCECFITLI
jgi:hypothetical protein